ncbi:O-antigen ligase family protein [Rubidibacter lacunae]|nr:O-antigen ligase family protein [Rubidibacter lacunae]
MIDAPLLEGGKVSVKDIFLLGGDYVATIAFTYLGFYVLSKYWRWFSIVLVVQVLLFSLAFFQHPLTPLTSTAQDMRARVAYANIEVAKGEEAATEALEREVKLKEQISDRFRVSGPYITVIRLSYALTASSIIAMYFYARSSKYSQLYLYAIVFNFLVSILSQTRSVIAAHIILLSYALLKYIGSRKRITNPSIYFLALAVLGIIAVYAPNDLLYRLGGFDRIHSVSDSGLRIWLWILGLVSIAISPLGVTTDAHREAQQIVFSWSGIETIFEYTSHNGIINIGVLFTVFGLFVFFSFIYLAMRLNRRLAPEVRNFFVVAAAAYLMQIMTHNDFIFIKDYHILSLVSIWCYECRNIGVEQGTDTMLMSMEATSLDLERERIGRS